MSSIAKVVEKQVLRGLVLRITEAAEPLGAGTEVILAAIRQYGYSASKDDIAECCNYLQGKELVKVERVGNTVLGLSRDIAHITPKGVDALEGTEQIDGVVLG